MDCDTTPEFAGDLFLRLASTGVLVLEPDYADQLIAELTETLDLVRARYRLLELLQRQSRIALATDLRHLEQVLVDVVFAEQIAPGRLEKALCELPKYIRAFEIAKTRHPKPPR